MFPAVSPNEIGMAWALQDSEPGVREGLQRWDELHIAMSEGFCWRLWVFGVETT